MAFTAVTENVEWQHIAFLNEYVGAQREREIVAYGSAATPLAADGDNIQSAVSGVGLIATLQDVGSDLFNSFVKNSAADFDGSGDTADWFHDNRQELWDSAGLTGVGGFRRATTLPTDWTDYSDAAFSYGYMADGDIIGPWLFVDLQALYGALTRTLGGDSVTSVSSGWGASGAEAVWQDAKDAADADWPVGTTVGDEAYAWTRGVHQSVGAGEYFATAARKTTKITMTVNASVSRDVSYYAFIAAPKLAGYTNATYDDQGDVADDAAAMDVDAYNLMLTETHGTGEGVTFESIGTIGTVAAATQPATWIAAPGADETNYFGWRSASIVTTIDWNFVY